MPTLAEDIRACRLCADRFAATATAHVPRPIVWLNETARILIAGQAPGARVQRSGRPFSDPSGDRLRAWMGVTDNAFYDQSRIAILPMAFCFPGYSAKGADLPPPPICARQWRAAALASLPAIRLTLLVGGSAMKWHLNTRAPVSEIVRNWQDLPTGVFALPHPSWRNTAWLKQNPWFAAEVLPRLQAAVREEMML